MSHKDLNEAIYIQVVKMSDEAAPRSIKYLYVFSYVHICLGRQFYECHYL